MLHAFVPTLTQVQSWILFLGFLFGAVLGCGWAVVIAEAARRKVVDSFLTEIRKERAAHVGARD